MDMDRVKRRMRKAIQEICADGGYPSAAKISKQMGRRTSSLSGSECKLRQEIFRELGIKINRRGGPPPFTA